MEEMYTFILTAKRDKEYAYFRSRQVIKRIV